jgi:hypothetical protein
MPEEKPLASRSETRRITERAEGGWEVIVQNCQHCGIKHDPKECCLNPLWAERVLKLEAEAANLRTAWDTVRSRILCTIDDACFEHQVKDAFEAVAAMDALVSPK